MKKFIILLLFVSFCTSPQSSELYESADEAIPSSENEDEIVATSSTTTSTIISTTTTLANDYILHLEAITAEKIWLIDFARRVNKTIYEWNEPKTLTYQEYKKILSSFIEEAQKFNEKVRGIEPPNKYDFLKVSQIDLNLLSDIILADIVELLAGAESSDTGQREAAALSSFNFNSEAFVNKVSEIVTLSLSPTTSLITTTTTTIAPTTTTSSTTTTTIAPTTTASTTTTVATLIRNDFDIIDLPVPTLIRVNTHVKETSESPYWKNKSGDELTIVFRLDTNSETGWQLPYENVDGSIDLRNPSVSQVFIDFTYQADCYIQSGSNIRDYPDFYSQTDPRILRIDKSLDPPITGSELNDFNCKTSNKIPIYTITIYISKTNPFSSFTDFDLGNVAYVRYYFGAHSSRDIEPSLSCNTEEFLSKNFPRVETHDWGVKGCRTVDTFNFPETNNPLGFDYSGTGNNGYQVEWKYNSNIPSFNLSDR